MDKKRKPSKRIIRSRIVSTTVTIGLSYASVVLVRRMRHRRAYQRSIAARQVVTSLSEAQPEKVSRLSTKDVEPDVQPEGEGVPVEETAVSNPVKPATWQELEPEDASDPVPHVDRVKQAGVAGWQLIGASRRGKMHAHQGTYREDAFAIDVVNSWHIVAVSDGAGSCRLSRVGSHKATETAVSILKQSLTANPTPTSEQLTQFLDDALQAAHQAVHEEAELRDLPVKEFSATLLLMVHGLLADKHIIGSTQVGDGLIVIQYQDCTIEPLAEGDSGAYGGETYFLTSKPATAWVGRATVRPLDQAPMLLAAMSDGVADDFIPYEKHLSQLVGHLTKVANRAEGYDKGETDEVLLQLISYDKRGSFDDRTLVMLYPEPAS